MQYVPTTWVEGVTRLGPTNMNKIEAGVAAALPKGTRTDIGPLFLDMEGSGTGSGATTGSVANFVFLKIASDDIAQASNAGGLGISSFPTVVGLGIEHHFGGANTKGVRIGMYIDSRFDGGATSGTNPNRFYQSFQTQLIATSGDGGTAGAWRGAVVGAGFVVEVDPPSTYLAVANAAEFDILINAGSHVQYVSGIQVVCDLLENGEVYDCAIAISSLDRSGGRVGFQNGILFGGMNGGAPLSTTSTVMKVQDNATLANGFDFTNTTFTGFVIRTNGFAIKAPAGDHIIEVGRQDGVASVPAIRFHSGTTLAGWDTMFLASGGSGVAGQGFLNLYTAQYSILGQSTSFPPLLVNAITGQTADLTTWQVNSATLFTIQASGRIKTAAANETTGAGSAVLGANSPAVTNTAPYKWLRFTTSDGSAVFVPAWK